MKTLKDIVSVVAVVVLFLVFLTTVGTLVDNIFLERLAKNINDRIWLTDVLRLAYACFCGFFTQRILKNRLIAVFTSAVLVLLAEMPFRLVGFQPFFSGLSRVDETLISTLALMIIAAAVVYWRSPAKIC